MAARVVRFNPSMLAAALLLPLVLAQRFLQNLPLDLADGLLEIEPELGNPGVPQRSRPQEISATVADTSAPRGKSEGSSTARPPLERHRHLDRVFELPHVSGPGAGLQMRQGLRRQLRRGNLFDAADLFDKVPRQQRNVLRDVPAEAASKPEPR